VSVFTAAQARKRSEIISMLGDIFPTPRMLKRQNRDRWVAMGNF
jgi:hypothetical protein